MRSPRPTRRTPCSAPWALKRRKIRARNKKRAKQQLSLGRMWRSGWDSNPRTQKVNRFRVCPVMTASIPLRIFLLPRSPENRREQQERTGYSIRALRPFKALCRQDFPSAAFRDEHTFSSQTRSYRNAFARRTQSPYNRLIYYTSNWPVLSSKICAFGD